MAQYRVNVRCILPPGLESSETRKREDAALLLLERAVYNVAEWQGMRDRQGAHDAMAKARCWTRDHQIELIRLGNYVITIRREA